LTPESRHRLRIPLTKQAKRADGGMSGRLVRRRAGRDLESRLWIRLLHSRVSDLWWRTSTGSPKVVRTGGPSGPLHDEWALSVRVQCDTPVRAVAFLDVDGIRWHARDWARRAECVAELRVSFLPHDWEHTDKVQISTAGGGIRVQVESGVVKVDPVGTTKLDVEPGTPGFTGVPMSILSVPDVGVALRILLVRSTDTKADRTRWRVRDEHVGSMGEFSFLSTGERAGQTPAAASR
jgi:hypothetical protein